MPYQKPKDTHPWRRYADRKVSVTVETHSNIIPVREFILELAQHWDDKEIILTKEFEGSNCHLLRTLPQERQALWIASQLKRFYVIRDI
jgi:hypothetical protein